MSYIDFKCVQAARERLSGQISILREIQEELEQTEHRIEDMVYTEEAVCLLHKGYEEVQEEIKILQSFVKCLEEVEEVWKKTECRIADMYDLEIRAYPRTVFGTSRITGLDGYEQLLAFQE